jgi:1-aminocyclopropane-1-carboxylate deaminase/D-cysteine desulfhydrase-like pyridoxal-dependent ACC family enzyme
VIIDPRALTPWERRNGRWYKREDLHRNGYGVNGAKYRACRWMIENAKRAGYDHIVSAQSVLSPQSSICATLAEEYGMACTLVYGATRPSSAVKHPNVRIAMEAGAMMDTSRTVAYNGVIQPYAAQLAEVLGAWQLPYAISMPDDASTEELQGFMEVGGAQVKNLPEEIRTLVIPFGSGNTTAGVLYGLWKYMRGQETIGLNRVVLVGVGPDRTDWLRERLSKVGVNIDTELPEIDVMPLHGWFAEYGDKMKETVDDIVMHPTYEGKVVRFLNGTKGFWHDRDGSTGLWIVGGPIS